MDDSLLIAQRDGWGVSLDTLTGKDDLFDALYGMGEIRLDDRLSDGVIGEGEAREAQREGWEW